MEGKGYIQGLKSKRILLLSLQGLVLSFGIALLVGSLLHYFLGTGYWTYVAAFLLSTAVFLGIHPLWKINEQHIVRHLDSQFPELEESSGLLLKTPAQLGALQHLQAQKILPLLPSKNIFNDLHLKNWISFACLMIGLSSYLFTPPRRAYSAADQLEANNTNISLSTAFN